MLISKLLIGMSFLSKSCWAGLILTLLFFAADKMVRKKSRRGEDYILVFIMFVYFITLLMITGVFAPWSLQNAHNFQLILFRDFNGTYFLLNILVFLPMGILLPALFQKDGKFRRKYIVFGFMGSMGIEVIQFLFTGRLADIDDVAANTIGCFIGYLVFWSIKKYWNIRKIRLPGYGTYGFCLSLLGYVFGIPYRLGLCLGDMLLVQWGVPIWSGNQGGALSFQGIHYSLVVYFAIQMISFWIVMKNKKDPGAKIGKVSAISGMVFFGILMIRNMMQNIG